jgi:hypothetical protein
MGKIGVVFQRAEGGDTMRFDDLATVAFGKGEAGGQQQAKDQQGGLDRAAQAGCVRSQGAAADGGLGTVGMVDHVLFPVVAKWFSDLLDKVGAVTDHIQVEIA